MFSFVLILSAILISLLNASNIAEISGASRGGCTNSKQSIITRADYLCGERDKIQHW